jgi:hypothetical protein
MADYLFRARPIRIPGAVAVFKKRQAIAETERASRRRVHTILRLVSNQNQVPNAFFLHYLLQFCASITNKAVFGIFPSPLLYSVPNNYSTFFEDILSSLPNINSKDRRAQKFIEKACSMMEQAFDWFH